MITFTVEFNAITGDGDLYLKKCENIIKCFFEKKSLGGKEVTYVINNQIKKKISHSFECKHENEYQGSICIFAIGVLGKENHGTHFDIVVQESNFHRLLTPGHSLKLNLNQKEQVYLKFSYPSTSYSERLFLSVESIWGDFNIFIDKQNEYPSLENHEKQLSFYSSKSGLYNSLRKVEIRGSDYKEGVTQGLYYLTVNSLTSCSLNLKFYSEKGD